MSDIVLFRFHRGTLDESMETVEEVDAFEDLLLLVAHNMDLELVSLSYKPYGYDHRIDWDTQIVMARFKGFDAAWPVGFLNKDPKWKEEFLKGGYS